METAFRNNIILDYIFKYLNQSDYLNFASLNKQTFSFIKSDKKLRKKCRKAAEHECAIISAYEKREAVQDSHKRPAIYYKTLVACKLNKLIVLERLFGQFNEEMSKRRLSYVETVTAIGGNMDTGRMVGRGGGK